MHETSERIFQSILERSKNYSDLFRKKTLISFSGGKDSRLLLELYRFLHRNGTSPEPVIFHLNHRIRDNQDQEKEILEFIKSVEYPYIYNEDNIPETAAEKKMSLEETGRVVRLSLLKKAAEQENLIIAAGHHTEDYLESVFIHLIRGAGEAAFRTMPVFEDGIFRPLLFLKKKEIEEILKTENWNIFEDESNFSMKYTRNRIRHRVMPILSEEGMDSFKTYWNFHDSPDEALIETRVSAKSVSVQRISGYGLSEMGISDLKRILDSYARLFGGKPFKRKFLENLKELLRKGSSFSTENREFLLYRSAELDLYMIPLSSKVFQEPEFSETDRKLSWNGKESILPENAQRLPYSGDLKVLYRKKHRRLSEIYREIGIPSVLRKNLPVYSEENGDIKVLLSWYSDALSDI